MDITNGQKLLHILDSHCRQIAAEDLDNILSYHLINKDNQIEHEKVKAMGLSGRYFQINEIIKQLRQLLVCLSEYRAGDVIPSLININECFEQLCLLKVGNSLQDNSRNS